MAMTFEQKVRAIFRKYDPGREYLAPKIVNQFRREESQVLAHLERVYQNGGVTYKGRKKPALEAPEETPALEAPEMEMEESVDEPEAVDTVDEESTEEDAVEETDTEEEEAVEKED